MPLTLSFKKGEKLWICGFPLQFVNGAVVRLLSEQHVAFLLEHQIMPDTAAEISPLHQLYVACQHRYMGQKTTHDIPIDEALYEEFPEYGDQLETVYQLIHTKDWWQAMRIVRKLLDIAYHDKAVTQGWIKAR